MSSATTVALGGILMALIGIAGAGIGVLGGAIVLLAGHLYYLGRYGFAVRVVPAHRDLATFAELGRVTWA